MNWSTHGVVGDRVRALWLTDMANFMGWIAALWSKQAKEPPPPHLIEGIEQVVTFDGAREIVKLKLREVLAWIDEQERRQGDGMQSH